MAHKFKPVNIHSAWFSVACINSVPLLYSTSVPPLGKHSIPNFELPNILTFYPKTRPLSYNSTKMSTTFCYHHCATAQTSNALAFRECCGEVFFSSIRQSPINNDITPALRRGAGIKLPRPRSVLWWGNKTNMCRWLLVEYQQRLKRRLPNLKL